MLKVKKVELGSKLTKIGQRDSLDLCEQVVFRQNPAIVYQETRVLIAVITYRNMGPRHLHFEGEVLVVWEGGTIRPRHHKRVRVSLFVAWARGRL